jgi:hypothetical protein
MDGQGRVAAATIVVLSLNFARALPAAGTAELIDEGADEHIDQLAKKYLGQDRYPFRNRASSG